MPIVLDIPVIQAGLSCRAGLAGCAGRDGRVDHAPTDGWCSEMCHCVRFRALTACVTCPSSEGVLSQSH